MSGKLMGAFVNFALGTESDTRRGIDFDRTVDAFVNWVGCAIGGSATTAVEIAVRARADMNPGGTHSIIGRDERLGLQEAIFIDCLSSAVLGFDDAHLETILHPTGPVAAALLGLARTRRINGNDFITALAVGMEIECRAALTFATPSAGSKLGWYSTGLTGAIGAASAVGRLLGFDKETMASAIALAASSGCGNRGTHATMGVSYVPALSAEDGYKAAMLARAGYICSPKALDGDRGLMQLVAGTPAWDRALRDLGTVPEASRNTLKPYPCAIVMHPMVNACEVLAQEYGVHARDVRQLEIVVTKATKILSDNKHPRDVLEASVSTPYWAMAVLTSGETGMANLKPESILDPAIADLQERVVMVVSPALADDESRVTATLNDGRRIEAHIKHAVGSAENPMTSEDVDKKFIDLARDRQPRERTDKLLRACRNIASSTDVASILTT